MIGTMSYCATGSIDFTGLGERRDGLDRESTWSLGVHPRYATAMLHRAVTHIAATYIYCPPEEGARCALHAIVPLLTCAPSGFSFEAEARALEAEARARESAARARVDARGLAEAHSATASSAGRTISRHDSAPTGRQQRAAR